MKTEEKKFNFVSSCFYVIKYAVPTKTLVAVAYSNYDGLT